MADYKYLDKEKTKVKKYPATTIVEGGKGWQEYLDYVAAGDQTDPWKTPEELLEDALVDKLQELRSERNRRVDEAVGTSDPRRKDRIISRSVKLLRREAKGQATAEEIAELNTMEVLDDFLDDLDSEHDTAEQWLSDPFRTIEQIQGYDVATDPAWSVLA